MLLLFSLRVADWPPVWERGFTVRVFRECLSIFVCVLLSFFGLIVFIPNHCLSIYIVSFKTYDKRDDYLFRHC